MKEPLAATIKRSSFAAAVGLFFFFLSLPAKSTLPFTTSLVMRPRYIDVATVVESLPADLKQYVRIEEKQNLMLINATPAIVRKIKEIVSDKDKVPHQIMVQILAVEIAVEKGSQIGIDWTWWWRGEREKEEKISVEGLAIGYTSKNITATISALAGKGKARVLGNPQIITLNGNWAQVQLETERYFELLTGPPEEPYFGLEEVTVRTGMKVRPRLASGKDVLLDLEITVDDLNQAAGIPSITRRYAKTTVKTRSGRTIAIAGLSEEVQREMREKVPGLADVPVVDVLFSRKYAMERKTELVIFVTPYVLQDRLPAADFALAAATWNTLSFSPGYSIESQRFGPQAYLSLTGCLGTLQNELGYRAEIGSSLPYNWSISGRCGLSEENYRLSFLEVRFENKLVDIREDLYISLGYKLRQLRLKNELTEEKFQQNLYFISLMETNSLSPKLQLTGKISLVCVEEKGELSPLIYSLSGGPLYYLEKRLSLSGRYNYTWSRQTEYEQTGYAVEIQYTSAGKEWAFTAGYQATNQETVRYMVAADPPIRGYYATLKFFLK